MHSEQPPWVVRAEARALPDSHRRVVLEVAANLNQYVGWPLRAELLWEGCSRQRENAQKQRYHKYPPELKEALARLRFTDGRSNGPAIASYLMAGGERPLRSTGNSWHIHHLYDGKFPYPGDNRQPSIHAAREPRHFTQSAGLVAVHPLADALADEFAVFAWRLRAESFLRFGYDPECAFNKRVDDYGFAGPRCGKVWYADRLTGSD